MRYTEIYYTVNGGKESVDIVRDKEGWEANYYENVVNRIQTLLDAPEGYNVVIKRVRKHEGKVVYRWSNSNQSVIYNTYKEAHKRQIFCGGKITKEYIN